MSPTLGEPTLFCNRSELLFSYSTLGGVGAAAHASPNSTFYCEFPVYLVHLGVGSYFTLCGFLILGLGILAACKRRFSNNVHGCAFFTIVCIAVVFVVFMFFSYFGLLALSSIIGGMVFGSFSSISTYHCNLVIYYLAFADIVIIYILTAFLLIVVFIFLALIISAPFCMD